MSIATTLLALSVVPFPFSEKFQSVDPAAVVGVAKIPFPTRASDLAARIDARGLEVDVPARSGGERAERVLGVEMASFGRVGSAQPVEAGSLTAGSARFEIRRGAVVEWFEARISGIEHGWTISSAPKRAEEGGDLWIGVQFRGLWPQISEGGLSASLVDEQGVQRLSYRGLKAWDASGRALEARMDTVGAEFGIRVADEGAAYPITVDPILGTADFTFESNQAGGYIQQCAPGDFNGDGFSDLIVGAINYNGVGRVWMFRGSANGLETAPSWETSGPNQAGAQYGAPCSLGDIDADGYDDFAISATTYDGSFSDEGLVQVYRGSATVPSIHWTFTGGASNYYLSAESYAGDVNGDGRDDLVLRKSPQNNESLELIPGSASATPPAVLWTIRDLDLPDLDAGYQNLLRHTGSGDVDADGYDDLLVGAIQDSNRRGIAYLFRGGPSGPSSTTPTWKVQLAGAPNDTFFGIFADIVGDIDANGYADVVASARGSPAPAQGSFHVYLADPSAHGSSLLPLTPSQSFLDPYAENYRNFGSGRSAGDFDGDGFADVLIGGEVSPPPNNDGDDRILLYRGSVTGLSASPTWEQYTPQLSSNFGTFVGSAGDVNGDGRTDVWVSARGLDNPQIDEGAVFVYHGRVSTISGTIATGQSSLVGPPTSGFGTTLATGDVNGDGLQDILVGAPEYSNGEVDEGRVALYLANEVVGFQAAPIWTFESNVPNARLGAAVAVCGDIDNDGFDDVLLGAPNFTNGQNDEGKVWLFPGNASGNLGTTPAWFFESDSVGARFGASVAGAGDCDADGLGDVIVGAPGTYLGNALRGHARVFYGRPGAALQAADSTILDGGQAGAQFGFAVSGADDVNRDGYSDVLIGSPDWSNGQAQEGRAYAFLGGPNGVSTTANWVYESNTTNARLGAAISTAGDVNRDGQADAIVGAPDYTSGPIQGGTAFLFLAQPGVGPSLQSTPASSVPENQAGAKQGASVAFAGDVNSDGFSDVLVGAPDFDGAAGTVANGGRVQLYLGASVPLVPVSWSREGSVTNGRLGTWCAGGADFDGDGFSDFAYGIPGNVEVYVNPGVGGQTSYFGSDQRRVDDTRAIGLLGFSEATSGFRIQGTSFNANFISSTVVGREDYRLEYEYELLAGVLDGIGVQRSATFVNSGSVTGTPPPAIRTPIAGLAAGNAYQWRVRVEHRNPLVPHTRWLYVQGNGARGKKLGTAPDCNGNGISDTTEILGNDCNNDLILDDCQVPPICPTCADCNGNGVPDNCELDFGNDCDFNQIPDDCQPDCDSDMIADACEIIANPSLDTNLDGVLDSCQPIASVFCPGDGTGTACPCGNSSVPADAEGCRNSLGTGGRLRSSGVPRISADNFTLLGTRMPNSSALYFQGTIQQSAGAGVVFGDGKRCAAGAIIRLGTKSNSGGASQYPVPGDTSISVRGMVPLAGATRTYQCWYRNAAAFCTVSTFNLTNGLSVGWVP